MRVERVVGNSGRRKLKFRTLRRAWIIGGKPKEQNASFKQLLVTFMRFHVISIQRSIGNYARKYLKTNEAWQLNQNLI